MIVVSERPQYYQYGAVSIISWHEVVGGGGGERWGVSSNLLIHKKSTRNSTPNIVYYSVST
jgi:hypothetical protein